jgi:hypothetical protein
MTLVAIDGFDLYNGTGTGTGLQGKWVGVATSSNLQLVSGRIGGQALHCGGQNSGTPNATVYRVLPSTYTDLGVGFAIKVDTLSGWSGTTTNNICIVLTDNAGAVQVGLAIGNDGKLHAYRLTGFNAGTLLGSTAAGVLTTGTWQYLEWGVTISDTVGVFAIKVDGVSVLNLTAQDTRNGTPTTVARIYFTQSLNNSTFDVHNLNVDDLYIVDSATTLGERRVQTLYPTSDVAQGFARSTGATNYTLVDETLANGDTDYVQGSSVGDLDTYGFGDVTGTPTTIDAVQVSAFADVTARQIALQLKSSATSSDGSGFALATTYAKYERIVALDPNTSGAWSATTVNALQGGPKVTV